MTATNKPAHLRVFKSVQVPVDVEVTILDVLRTFDTATIRNEAERRGIPIKKSAFNSTTAPKHKIERADIDEMLAAFRRRDWAEFLYALEWALPRDFRGLSDFMGSKLK